MEALLVIDYSYDFVANDGALTLGAQAQAIQPTLTSLLNSFIKTNNPVIFVCDDHDRNNPYHPEWHLFPLHCLSGTRGQKLYGDIEQFYLANSGHQNIHYLPKQRYSAFCGTSLDLLLRERCITKIHLAGLATDICILHTAIAAYNLNYELIIHEEAMAGFTPEGHNWALAHMKNILGATIIKEKVAYKETMNK